MTVICGSAASSGAKSVSFASILTCATDIAVSIHTSRTARVPKSMRTVPVTQPPRPRELESALGATSWRSTMSVCTVCPPSGTTPLSSMTGASVLSRMTTCEPMSRAMPLQVYGRLACIGGSPPMFGAPFSNEA